jgi:hypothetical protein
LSEKYNGGPEALEEMMVATRFSGLSPWKTGTEIIECRTDLGTVDLHNDATLEVIEFPCRPNLEVVLRFHDSNDKYFRLRFSGVLDLVFQQDPDDRIQGARDWNPEDVETLYGIEYLEGNSTPSGVFTVATILGSMHFRAAEVSVVLD